jgi:hypothetical protein
VPLELDRDWFDYLAFGVNVVAAAGGVFAAFLAVLAYRSAQKANELAERQGRESRELVAHERRVTFELEVLRDLHELAGATEMQANLKRWGGYAIQEAAGARLRMLPSEEFRSWEKIWGLGLEEMRENYGGEHRDVSQAARKVVKLLLEDVEEAIDVRVRDTPWHRM